MNDNPSPIKPIDGILELVVNGINTLENKTDGRITEGITLCVNGMLISGIIISQKEFMRSHLLLENIDEMFDRLENEGTIPNKSDDALLQFIHLKQAFIYSPGQSPIPTDENGTFWRGRLSSVDGFFMGNLKHEKK